MSRNRKAGDRVRVDIWILASQNRELEEVCVILGKTKTDAMVEALAYWLSAQQRMLNQQPAEVG